MVEPLFFKLHNDNIKPPSKFTFPFYYIPHPLSILAVKNLQEKLLLKKLNHKFWPDGNNIAIGKMFGVLVCKNINGEIGYLAAVSGELINTDTSDFLVPSVAKKIDDTFEKCEVKRLNIRINDIENSSSYKNAQDVLLNFKKQYEKDLEYLRAQKASAKKQRKIKREHGADEGELIKESIFYKKRLKLLNQKV